jgi:hypothetical protein
MDGWNKIEIMEIEYNQVQHRQAQTGTEWAQALAAGQQ